MENYFITKWEEKSIYRFQMQKFDVIDIDELYTFMKVGLLLIVKMRISVFKVIFWKNLY